MKDGQRGGASLCMYERLHLVPAGITSTIPAGTTAGHSTVPVCSYS